MITNSHHELHQWLKRNQINIKQNIKNTNKTIVCDHYHTDGICEKFNLDLTGTNEFLYSEDDYIIFTDTCAPLTRRVNVLTISNE